MRSTAPENDRMTVRIAIVGDLDPAKHSHRELEAARSLLGSDVETTWVATDSPAMAGIAAGTTAACWVRSITA